MTGPQHYTEGERLLVLSDKPPTDGGPRGLAEADVMIAQAHAHFAAAKVAATVAEYAVNHDGSTAQKWRDVIL